MSITVTTDVFCNGCPAWTPGVTGQSVNRPEARAEARRSGWTHHKGKYYCPDCTHRKALS